MSKQPWALVLGASSGFGAAAALELAAGGMHIAGVHLDRRETLPRARALEQRIRDMGREALFFNANAADDERRAGIVDELKARLAEPPATVRLLLHSLAFGALKPVTEISRKQLETTIDVMGNSLAYWVQDLLREGLLASGARVLAMTSSGSRAAIPLYGPVSAAKAVLEVHIRQLALELAPRGITANAILAGVTDTPALRQIPGHEKLMEFARMRNPHGRLTTPEDVARVVSLLADERSAWITGATIQVDGGENAVG